MNHAGTDEKIAENKELQAQLKGCKDAKTMAQLLGIDEALAEKLFPKMKAFLENDTLPDDLLDQAAGGWGRDPSDIENEARDIQRVATELC